MPVRAQRTMKLDMFREMLTDRGPIFLKKTYLDESAPNVGPCRSSTAAVLMIVCQRVWQVTCWATTDCERSRKAHD